MVHCHGLVYDLHDGILLGLGIHIDNNECLNNFREKVILKKFMPNA